MFYKLQKPRVIFLQRVTKYRGNKILELNNIIKELENELEQVKNNVSLGCVSNWVPFDFMKIETRPTQCGKYLICRKDGKIHWEQWNGSGWAYNHKEIRYWAHITPPCC